MDLASTWYHSNTRNMGCNSEIGGKKLARGGVTGNCCGEVYYNMDISIVVGHTAQHMLAPSVTGQQRWRVEHVRRWRMIKNGAAGTAAVWWNKYCCGSVCTISLNGSWVACWDGVRDGVRNLARI